MSSAFWNSLLEKSNDWDKDERYMATNDICNELSKDVKIDEVLERRICIAVLRQLDDKSSDVQSVAVKCLSILLRKVHPAQMHEICEKLGSLLLEGNGQLADIYCIGLKTLISDAPEELGQLITDDLCPRLLHGINRNGSDDIKKECLDIMSDLLRRFGHLFIKDHNEIMQALIRILRTDKAALRKRASACLSALTIVASDQLLNRLVDVLLSLLAECENSIGIVASETQSLIQTLCSIAKVVGHRLGRDLDKMIPLFLKFCGKSEICAAEENETKLAAMNEIQEYCFSGLESFVLRCQREVSPYLNDILLVATDFIKYDPNYTYDDEEEEEIGGENDECYDEDMMDEGEYGGSDDDDNSWKVRKNAVRVLSAIISCASAEVLGVIVNSYSALLLSRLKEREENVRLDIMNCWITMLSTYQSLRSNNAPSGTFIEAASDRAEKGFDDVGDVLKGCVSGIVRQFQKQMDGHSLKTKTQYFCLLRSFIDALKLDLTPHMPLLLTSTDAALRDKNQSLRLEALIFLRTLLEFQTPTNIFKYSAKLMTPILGLMVEDWYKIVAESIRVCAVIVDKIRPQIDVVVAPVNAEMSALVCQIYSILLPKLAALDIDQEIKECAVVLCGKLFAIAGDVLSDKLSDILSLLHKRLDNEVLRVTTLRAINAIAKSNLRLDISQHVPLLLADIALFLRQQNRNLKLTSLHCIGSLILSQNSEQLLQISVADSVFREISTIIDENDLYLTTVAINLANDVFLKRTTFRTGIVQAMYAKLLQIAKSNLLHGQSLSAAVDCLKAISLSNTDLLQSTVTELRESAILNAMHKQSVFNMAKCIVGICINNEGEHAHICSSMLHQFLDDLRSSDERRWHLALLVAGDIVTASSVAVPEMKDLILKCFECGGEDVKVAAAYSLGHLAAGNIQSYLPIILDEGTGVITQQSSNRHQYFLLSALKEMVSAYSFPVFAANRSYLIAQLDSILPHLCNKFAEEDEGVRSMVAECIGALISLNYSNQIHSILLSTASEASIRYRAHEVDNLQSEKLVGAARSLWTVISSIRFAISRPLTRSEDVINLVVAGVRYIDFPDLEVRKASLLLVNSCLHHNPHIATVFVAEMIPYLLELFTFKAERTVDLGPFKHKVDDGLPLRRFSLTCFESILNTRPGSFVFTESLGLFSTKIVPLLSDKDELKTQCHQLIIKICLMYPNIILTDFIEAIIDPLDKTINKKPPASTTPASTANVSAAGSSSGDATSAVDIDRHVDLVRSALRVSAHVNSLPSSALVRRWSEFMDRLSKHPQISSLLQQVLSERSDDI